MSERWRSVMRSTMPHSGMTDVSGPSYAQMPTAVRYSFVDWALPKLPRRHEPTRMTLENQPHIIRPAIILRIGYSVYSVYIYIFQFTLKAPITTAADDIHEYFFHCFSEKLRLDVSSESSARQKIHMKNQALFS